MLFKFLTTGLIRHLWQLKTVVLLHWGIIFALPVPFSLSQCLERDSKPQSEDYVPSVLPVMDNGGTVVVI